MKEIVTTGVARDAFRPSGPGVKAAANEWTWKVEDMWCV